MAAVAAAAVVTLALWPETRPVEGPRVTVEVEPFYMGATGYATHFVEHYLRSDRHIVRTWLGGMLQTIGEIWEHRHSEDEHEGGDRNGDRAALHGP